MRTLFPWTSVPLHQEHSESDVKHELLSLDINRWRDYSRMQKDYQVERICEHWKRQCKPKHLSRFFQILVDAFRQLQLQKDKLYLRYSNNK